MANRLPLPAPQALREELIDAAIDLPAAAFAAEVAERARALAASADFAAQLEGKGGGGARDEAAKPLPAHPGEGQLTNRSMTGVNMNGPRCPGQELPFFSKNFADQNLTSGGWSQHALIGTTIRGVQDLGSSGNFYAYINNFQQGASENWYISPAIDITSLSTPKLSFRNACRFTGPLLEVLVSTTYDGTSAPNLPDWTALSPPLDTNAAQYVWTESGLVDISAFSSSNFPVAFRYLGDNGNGRGWEIDDIKIVQ